VKAFFGAGALNSLQDARRRIESLNQLYDFVNGFNYRGITINSWQKKTEIGDLLRLLEESRPHSIAEIGTASGGTLFMLTQIAAPDATIVSVDLPGGTLGGLSSSMHTSTHSGEPASIADSDETSSQST
jgi:cephalosporin hydroxylase